MGVRRPGFELRVELATQKPGLVLDLALGLGAVDLGLGLITDVVSVVLQQGQGLVDVRLGVADVSAQRDIGG